MIKQSSVSLAGRWQVVHATLPNGAVAYTGTIAFQQIGAAFKLDWDITAGQYVGVGLMHAAHLYVSCGEHADGLGIALYTPGPDQAITVQWTSPDLQGEVGMGTFTSAWTGTWKGTHRVVHQACDRHARGEWTLHASRTDQVYELTWEADDGVTRTGLGIAMPGGLAAGWYPDVRQLALMDYVLDPHDDQQLDATWALGGYSALGSEVLRRT